MSLSTVVGEGVGSSTSGSLDFVADIVGIACALTVINREVLERPRENKTMGGGGFVSMGPHANPLIKTLHCRRMLPTCPPTTAGW